MGPPGRLRSLLSQLLPPRKPTQSRSEREADVSLDGLKTVFSATRAHDASLYETGIDPPPPAASKPGKGFGQVDELGSSRRPTDNELDTIEWGARLDGPSGSSTPREDIESRPASPLNISDSQAVAHIAPSIKYPYMNRWRTAACCIAFFIQGLNDSAPGALLPYMERYYNVRYAMVSLIFVANAIGFIIAAPFCHKLNNRFGRAKVLASCTTLNVIAYIALICQPPFAVVVIAFLFLGKHC